MIAIEKDDQISTLSNWEHNNVKIHPARSLVGKTEVVLQIEAYSNRRDESRLGYGI